MTKPRDIVVTVPMRLWPRWLAEGDLPGDPASEGGIWDFSMGTVLPNEAGAGSRVYVVSHGYLRGYAPMVRIEAHHDAPGGSFVREGGAAACTLLEPVHDGWMPKRVPGFRGWRYRWWEIKDEAPFTNWMTFGLPERMAVGVEHIIAERARGPEARAGLREWALSR